MVVPDSGSWSPSDARDVTHLPVSSAGLRLGIGYLPQERSDFRRLTVWDNLMAILETVNIKQSGTHQTGRTVAEANMV